MIQTAPINLDKSDYFSEPFPYFHSKCAMDPNAALQVLRWMETTAPWKLVETSFYEQYEFSLRDVEIPDYLSVLSDDSFATAVLEYMSNTFDVTLADKVEIVAHKLIPGQSIRIHNDCLEGGETHRLIIQLNSGWTNNNGGLFVIFSSADAEDIHRVISPNNNSAVGFEISSNSHHAVSTVYDNTRYSLVCSFRVL